MAGSSDDKKGVDKMDWMYKGPSALVDREDYLLGRTVDKSFKLLEAQEKGEGKVFSYADEVEKDLTPASIFSNRGQSGPVDIIRKIKEDPLYQIEKKEQETLKQLLQNPIRMKQLRKLAEEQKSSSKSKKVKKKKHRKRSSSSSSSDSDLNRKLDKSAIDKMLAAKLGALKKKSRKDDSSSSSSSSSDEDEASSRKEYSKNTDRNSRDCKVRDSSDHKNTDRRGHRSTSNRSGRDYHDKSRDHRRDHFRRPSSRDRRDGANRRRKSRSRSPRRQNYKEGPRPSSSISASQKDQTKQKKSLSEEEMERRRREMMENAKVRDEDRKRNVDRWKEEQKKEDEELAKQHDADFIRQHLLSAAETGSVEKRIKSNSYNIQKSTSTMNQNFARR